MLYWKIHNDLKLLATFNEIFWFAFIHSSIIQVCPLAVRLVKDDCHILA